MTIANFARTHSRRITLPALILLTAAVPAAGEGLELNAIAAAVVGGSEGGAAHGRPAGVVHPSGEAGADPP